jgi:hypothetical protein
MDEPLLRIHVSAGSVVRPVFDPTKPAHLWVAVAIYRMDLDDEGWSVRLVHETLLDLAGPTCYFCMLPPRRAAARCPGKPDP